MKGDLAVDENVNVVEEYKLGNTTVKIADTAYKDKTQEDINNIIQRLTNIVANSYNEVYRVRYEEN
jgi:hypothetical protein